MIAIPVTKYTVGAISLASFGMVPLFAEGTSFDFTTSGGIIAALFFFIGTCAITLYKAILAPLFDNFVKNLEASSLERSKFLEFVMEYSKTNADNKAKEAVNQEKLQNILTQVDTQLKTLTGNVIQLRTTNKERSNGGGSPLQLETPLPGQS